MKRDRIPTDENKVDLSALELLQQIFEVWG